MTLLPEQSRIRLAYPTMGLWLASTVLLTAVYWVACLYLLSDDLLVQMIVTPLVSRSPLAVLLCNIPLLAALGLAWPFRLVEPGFRAWLILIVAALLMTGFGYLVALLAAGLLNK